MKGGLSPHPSQGEALGGRGGQTTDPSHASLDKQVNNKSGSGGVPHTCDRPFKMIHCLSCETKIPVRAGSLDRTCPACSRKIYDRLYGRYWPIIKKAHIRGRLSFLTLTWKPVFQQDPLIVREIGSCFQRLLDRQPYRKVWRAVLATLECKKTDEGLFYYHLHVLLEGDYVKQAQISKDWAALSGFPVVWIKRVYRTVKKAFRYILKYVLKGFNFADPSDKDDFRASMKKVRFVRSYGSFYDLKKHYGKNYYKASHVPFPCPGCGAVGAWIATPLNQSLAEYTLEREIKSAELYPPFRDGLDPSYNKRSF
jgi:hypothetical protein